jgi:hypothetical protein
MLLAHRTESMLRFRVVLTVQCKLSKSKLELREEVFDREEALDSMT